MKITEKDLELIQIESMKTSPRQAVTSFLTNLGIEIEPDPSDYYHRMAMCNWHELSYSHPYMVEDAWIRSLTGRLGITLEFWYEAEYLPVDELT